MRRTLEAFHHQALSVSLPQLAHLMGCPAAPLQAWGQRRVASGAAHSLEEFVSMAFAEVGLKWRGHVDYDSSLVRPSDIIYSLGDPTKAAQVLDWRPTVKLPEIVARMIRAEQEGAGTV